MTAEEEQIIGKGTWIDKVASTLLRREKRLGRNLDMIVVESGLGASGFPHIGSIGDAVRAYGVALALGNFGYKAELIAYSDDMDGLRKVPQGLPVWLNEHLAKPVSTVPDPIGSCHASYGAHMSGLLLDALDRIKIKYRFQSGTEAYQRGILVDEIDTILRSSERLGKKISQLVGQQKYTETIPYFPICKNCGRLYVANAEQYIPDDKKIVYTCSGSRIGQQEIKGCGFKGEADIRKGEGKLAWKVEFAARWHALDVRFEAYGKDIMDSVRINDWVASEVLGFYHPMHVKYELFLDKGGKKISKSSGNVLTPQIWLTYGTPESILLLLFKRITGTRHVSINDIPSLMDEYDLYEDLYFGKLKESNAAKLMKIKGVYEYINHLEPPQQPQPHTPYRMLVQQASLFSRDDDRTSKVFARLLKYGIVKEKTERLLQRIELASNWADDQFALTAEKVEIEINESQRKAIMEILDAMRSFIGSEQDPETPKNLQSKVFEIARNNQIEPKEFFRLLYRILINADRGPRIGNYAIDLGLDRTCRILEESLVN
ncbi:MAG: lysine--tRNA ligase [Candidatus Nitrosopolaris sp.]